LKTVFTNSGKTFHAGGRNIYTIPSVILKIDSTIHDLSAFAAHMTYTYDILKTFNPWLIANALTNPGKRTYIIRFPKKDYLTKLIPGSEIIKEPVDSNHVRHNFRADSLNFKADSNMLPLRNADLPPTKDTGKNE
jgi:hypothetical protein